MNLFVITRHEKCLSRRYIVGIFICIFPYKPFLIIIILFLCFFFPIFFSLLLSNEQVLRVDEELVNMKLSGVPVNYTF